MSETAEGKGYVEVTSRAQWDAIEKRLRGIFGAVKFRIDGHEVAVQRKFVAEGRCSLWVYIDDKIEYKHMMPDKETKLFDPIVEKVWRPRVTHLVSPQKRKILELKWAATRYSKRDIQELKKTLGFDKHFLAYVPDYSTARTLVQRFRKIEGIEVEL